MWVDAKGYVYVGGDFTGAVMSVGNQFVNNHFDSARDEIYIFKLDPSLNVVWARSFGNGDTDEILYVNLLHCYWSHQAYPCRSPFFDHSNKIDYN